MSRAYNGWGIDDQILLDHQRPPEVRRLDDADRPHDVAFWRVLLVCPCGRPARFHLLGGVSHACIKCGLRLISGEEANTLAAALALTFVSDGSVWDKAAMRARVREIGAELLR